MYLSELPGHDAIKSYLRKVVHEDKIPHALLLTGQEGVGLLPIATGLAILVQCKDRTEAGACGTCSSCTKAAQLIHPDIHFAFPVIKKDGLKREDTSSLHFMKEFREFYAEAPFGSLSEWLGHLGAPDKQANINKKECSTIIKNLGLKTYEGGYKVQIIWYADYLQKEGNRLLKLIEEPSDDTLIILISANASRLLNTLRSRCQIVSVPPLSDPELLDYVKTHHELSDEDSQELAFLASGNVRKAQLLGQKQELNYSEELLEWLRTAYQGDPEKMVAFVDEMSRRGRQELVTFLEYGLHFLREYLHYLNVGQEELLRLTGTERKVALEMRKIISYGKTQHLRRFYERTIQHVRRNLALKPLLMALTIEINQILRSEDNNLVS